MVNRVGISKILSTATGSPLAMGNERKSALRYCALHCLLYDILGKQLRALHFNASMKLCLRSFAVLGGMKGGETVARHACRKYSTRTK